MRSGFPRARPGFAKSVLRIFAGVAAFAIAGLLALLELIALVDPMGTKTADDADPFGDPRIAWYAHAAMILAAAAFSVGGYWLLRSEDKK